MHFKAKIHQEDQQSEQINSEKSIQMHQDSSNNSTYDTENPSSSSSSPLRIREYSASDFNFLKVLG